MISSSPSLSVPPTQNTASVVRFRCLFTHDLRRKAKRWHDGFVRYHTFNKRVMVFDDQGNFVGDLHWRQEDMIQDGDEMELDKGVLIQVGESMEKTETDLSPLFEKKKASQPSPSQSQSQSQQSQPRKVPVPSAMPSSQSSRSLNDLLGIKRSPIERLKSPYEQRHQPPRPVENPELSIPAKRHRSSAEQGVPGKRPSVIDTVPVHKPTTAEPETPAPEPAPAPVRAAKPVPEPLAACKQAEPCRSTSSPAITSQNISKPSQPHSLENAQSTPQSVPSNPTASAPKNTLKLSKEKPRKKLMYRALLPGQAKSSDTSPAELERQSVPNPATPDPISTNLDLDPGDSTLHALAEMVDDSVFDGLELNEPPRIKEDAIESAQKGSEPPNPHIATAKPATSTPPLKNEPPSQPTTTNPPTDPSRPAMIPPAAVNPVQFPGIPPPPAQPSPRGFRKSLSDPSAFHTVNSIQSRKLPSGPLNPGADGNEVQAQAQGQIQDQGPWTCEASDLFDFWPPDRLKPG